MMMDMIYLFHLKVQKLTMNKIKCPKCKEEFTINIAHSISDDGEVFLCPHCNWKIRYVPN